MSRIPLTTFNVLFIFLRPDHYLSRIMRRSVNESSVELTFNISSFSSIFHDVRPWKRNRYSKCEVKGKQSSESRYWGRMRLRRNATIACTTFYVSGWIPSLKDSHRRQGVGGSTHVAVRLIEVINEKEQCSWSGCASYMETAIRKRSGMQPAPTHFPGHFPLPLWKSCVFLPLGLRRAIYCNFFRN